MISKIVHTISTRFVGVVIGLLLIVLTARYLGAEGRGYISILTFDIALVTIFSNIIGGTALVFLIPRYNFNKLYILSILWNVLISLVSWPILLYTGLLPEMFAEHFFILCFFQNVINTHQNILLAKQQIKWYNFSALLMNGINLALFFYLFNNVDGIFAFVASLHVAYFLTAVITFLQLRNHFNDLKTGTYSDILKQCFKHGLWAQSGNAMQLLNYRISYWFLNSFVGAAAVGIFSVIMAIIDAVLIVSRSIATVQYSTIANSYDNKENYFITNKMAKRALLLTILMFVLTILVPNNLYHFVLGKDFTEITHYLLFISIGVFFFGYSTIIAHYFSGIGKYKLNTLAALMGLIITFITGFVIIPKMGISGACITSSFSFIANSLLLIFLFRKRKSNTNTFK